MCCSYLRTRQKGPKAEVTRETMERGKAKRWRKKPRRRRTCLLLAQPRPCLVDCLSYLDSESIRQFCLLSKECRSVIHDDPGMAKTSRLMTQPRPCLVRCLSYLDPDSIRQTHKALGMATRWTKLLEIRPSSKDDNTNDVGRLDRLVNQLYHQRNELQLIQEIQIIDPHKFQYSDFYKIRAMLKTFQLSGIASLRMVSSSTPIGPTPSSINACFCLFLWIFPLQKLTCGRFIELPF